MRYVRKDGWKANSSRKATALDADSACTMVVRANCGAVPPQHGAQLLHSPVPQLRRMPGR